MLQTDASKPTSSAKIAIIIDSLESGKKREDLAYELGYTNPKSLDIFMRRKGFYYSNEISNYKPLKADTSMDGSSFGVNERIKSILAMLQDGSTDFKKVALLNGFEKNTELADFMKENGFVWDEGISNYKIDCSEGFPQKNDYVSQILNDMSTYLPFIKKLYEARDELLELASNGANHRSAKEDGKRASNDTISIAISTSVHSALVQAAAKEAISIEALLMRWIKQHHEA